MVPNSKIKAACTELYDIDVQIEELKKRREILKIPVLRFLEAKGKCIRLACLDRKLLTVSKIDGDNVRTQLEDLDE